MGLSNWQVKGPRLRPHPLNVICSHDTTTGGRSVNTGDGPSASTRLFYAQNGFTACRQKKHFIDVIGVGWAVEPVGAIDDDESLVV